MADNVNSPDTDVTPMMIGEAGSFEGRKTLCKACECPCGKPTVYFEDGSLCFPQTVEIRLRGMGAPEWYIEEIVTAAREHAANQPPIAPGEESLPVAVVLSPESVMFITAHVSNE